MVEKAKEETKAPEKDIFTDAPEVEFDESDRAGGTSGIGTRFCGIAQNTGTNVEKLSNAGKFFIKNEEDELVFSESLDVVMLESQRRGTRFENDSVVCRSYGGVVSMSGQKCASCPYNRFIKNDVPDGQKCNGKYVVLCVPADNWHAEPFFFSVGAGAIRDYKDYARELQEKHKRPIFSVVTRITTLLRDNGHKSMNYVPVFTPIKALDENDTANLRNLRIAESHRFKPIEETASSQAASATIEAEADAAGDRDPFVDE
jgi:hypothetical protein